MRLRFALAASAPLAAILALASPARADATSDPDEAADEVVPAVAITSTPPADEPSAPPPAPDMADDPHAGEDDAERRVYVSISPLHLLAPVVELTAEVRVHRKIGVAAIGGYGQVRAAEGGPRFTVWELGAQFVGYAVGSFDHGMQLGAEVLYVGVSGEDSAGSVSVSGAGNGLAAGPFVGYKLATKVGFSFNIQAGAQYMVARADATSSTGATAQSQQSSVIPLLNLNAGWSF
jgi:hypothetical protein